MERVFFRISYEINFISMRKSRRTEKSLVSMRRVRAVCVCMFVSVFNVFMFSVIFLAAFYGWWILFHCQLDNTVVALRANLVLLMSFFFPSSFSPCFVQLFEVGFQKPDYDVAYPYKNRNIQSEIQTSVFISTYDALPSDGCANFRTKTE